MIERILRYLLYAVAIFACFEIGYLARAARLSGGYVQTQVHDIVLPTQKLLGNATALANVAAQVVSQENKAFASQDAYFTELKTSTDKTFGRINDDLVPHMVTVLDTTSESVARVSSSVSDLTVAGTAELSKTQALTEALTVRVNDPAYDKIVGDATASMENLRSMTQSGAETLATVNKGVEYEYKQLTTPPKKIWIFVKGVASVAGNFFHL